jgi:hypothetical protein
MKTKKSELDVDFIGGQSSLRATEEKALNDFFKKRNTYRTTTKIKQRRNAAKREKVIA